jgi:hypothetical protein
MLFSSLPIFLFLIYRLTFQQKLQVTYIGLSIVGLIEEGPKHENRDLGKFPLKIRQQSTLLNRIVIETSLCHQTVVMKM